MDEPNIQTLRTIYTKAGYCFTAHYRELAHNASENLKAELRWKQAGKKFWRVNYKKIKELELNTIALLDQERFNLFNSIEWSHQNSKWELVCQLVDELATYFNVRSYWNEWVKLAELAVADAVLAGDSKLKAIALNNLSVVYRQFDRLSESIKCSQDSISLCRQVDDRYGEGLAFGNLGGSYFAQRDLQASIESYTEAIQIFKELGELYEQSQCLMGIGNVLARQQKLGEATSYLEASIKIQRKIGDRFGEAQALNSLGIVLRIQERFDEAIKSFQRSLTIKQEIGDQQGIANSLTNLAVAYERSGKIERAITILEKSLNILIDVNFSDYERAARRLMKLRLQTKEQK